MSGDSHRDMFRSISHIPAANKLQEFCCKHKIRLPDYHEESVMGSNERKTFVISCVLGQRVETGLGDGKKKAKEDSAFKMLTRLKREEMQHEIGDDPSGPVFQDIKTSSSGSILPSAEVNAVAELYILCSKNKLGIPEFALECVTGIPNNRTFEMSCSIGAYKEIGTGSTKKKAKEECSLKLLNKLKNDRVVQQPIEPSNGGGNLNRLQNVAVSSQEDKKFAVQRLYEVCTACKLDTPRFQEEGSEESEQSRTFVVSCRVGHYVQTGSGNSKMRAKADCALKVLHRLRAKNAPHSEDASDGYPGFSNAILSNGSINDSSNNDDSNRVSIIGKGKTPLMELRDFCTKHEIGVPSFVDDSHAGPPHMRTFFLTCALGPHVETGSGDTKKRAKEDCTKKMLDKLKREYAQYFTSGSSKSSSKDLNNDGGDSGGVVDDVKNGNNNNNKLAVGKLYMFCAKRLNSIPRYLEGKSTGKPHTRTFFMTCRVGPNEEIGSGSSKKIAKEECAAKMLDKLENSDTAAIPVRGKSTTDEKKKAGHIGTHPVLLLRDFCYERKLGEPSFTDEKSAGPLHALTFFTTCVLGTLAESGSGSTKKKARENSALKLLNKLKGVNEHETPSSTVVADAPDHCIRNSVKLLYDICSSHKLECPNFVLKSSSGPSNQPTFVFDCVLGARVESGTGGSKKAAKEEGAAKMLERLKAENVQQKPQRKDLQKSTGPDGGIKTSLTYLNYMCVVYRLGIPNFVEINRSGPPHEMTFVVSCTVRTYAENGSGSSLKAAKSSAAGKMIEKLQTEGIIPSSFAINVEKPENLAVISDLFKA